MNDLGQQCALSQFCCIKVEERSIVPFTRNPRNCPKHIFTLPDILYHISLTADADCLQFGKQEDNKHVIFASKFGKNRLASNFKAF